MDTMREVLLDETEWWDRVALALELLEKKSGATKHWIRVGGRPIQWIGNYPPPFPSIEKPSSTQATVYMFKDVSDVEILRRLSQMPDESELDLLVRPFVFYCPETSSLVSINVPEPPLEEMLEKLFNK